jgi:hypothetical protein
MPRPFVRVAVAVVCILQLVAMSTVAKAQAPPESESVCFVGKPMPRCKTFWLTEFGYYHRALGTGFIQDFETASFDRPDLDNHYAWDIGFMSNRSPLTAIGGTVHLGADGSGVRIGLKGRHRRWIAGNGVMDVSAGVLRAGIRAPYPELNEAAYGVTGDVALGWRDWAALTVRADVLRGDGRTVSALYGGVRLGSYPAIVGTVAAAAYLALLLFAYGGGT